MTDIWFYIGETWTIKGSAKKPDGSPLDLSGGSVEFRIASATDLIFKTTSADVAIDPGALGAYTINIPANDLRMNGLPTGSFDYEVDVTDALGGVTAQNVGKVLLKKSLRLRFP